MKTQEPFNPFTTPQRDKELMLIESVRTLLNEAGLKQKVDANFINHPTILDGVGLCYEAQRFVLNRFWHIQLQALQNKTNKSTIDERYCLVENGEPEQWLSLFEEKILPIAIQYNLPEVI